MPFETWWRGDPLPNLAPLANFSARPSMDIRLIVPLTELSEQEINIRIQNGNRLYIAFIDTASVAYGWVATREGCIAGFQFSFPILEQECYLWDFVTLPQWRGRGVYPHLLQEIIHQERRVERFWIGYELGNEASAHGIEKAGFHIVGDLFIAEDRASGFVLFNKSKYALASSNFFHLPIVGEA
jgi:GNAT superfamily N-acetyltransferase